MFKKQSAVRTKGKVKRRILDPNKRMLLGQVLVGVLLFSFVGLLGIAVWYGTRIERLSIGAVTVAGGETIPYELVTSIVESKLEGSYLGIVPRRFAWSYPEEEIYAAVPRIKDPVVTLTSDREISVAFSEYLPHALWCAEKESGECLFIDSAGYAFGPAPRLEGGALIRYRTLGREPAVHDYLVESSQLSTIATFIDLVKTGGRFEIAAVEIDMAGDIFYLVSGGGEFKAALRDSAAVVYDNLLTIISAKEFAGIKPGSFQYIDLRFGSKVFVNEEQAGQASSTSATSSDNSLAKKVLATTTATH
jgi:hypothetical protein